MAKKKAKTKVVEESPETYVLEIQESCSKLGWCIAMNDRKKGVRGLIIGSPDFINDVTDQLDNGDDYEIWAQPDKH